MSYLNDIEEFTERQLIDEVRRRQVARRDGFCWYCGRRPELCTCREKKRSQPPIAPKIVCLCGSTRFYEAFQKANYDLTMAGKIVLSIGFYPHSSAASGHGEGVGHDSAEKVELDRLHFRKIDLCDYVYVLNVDGYIGNSTRNEIEYANSLGKPIEYLEPII